MITIKRGNTIIKQIKQIDDISIPEQNETPDYNSGVMNVRVNRGEDSIKNTAKITGLNTDVLFKKTDSLDSDELHEVLKVMHSLPGFDEKFGKGDSISSNIDPIKITVPIEANNRSHELPYTNNGRRATIIHSNHGIDNGSLDTDQSGSVASKFIPNKISDPLEAFGLTDADFEEPSDKEVEEDKDPIVEKYSDYDNESDSFEKIPKKKNIDAY